MKSWMWVLVAAFIFTTVALVWGLGPYIGSDDGPLVMVGDPENIDSYGFNLDNLTISRQELTGGARRDQLSALSNPAVVEAAQIDQLNRERRAQHRGKLLVGRDRVIGVARGSDARAYPLRIINWHEVINDTIGDDPIAVTYSGLCDSAVVFERRIGERVYNFGVSGLLYNSNLVMYDDGDPPNLYSQLGMRAISGPAAGQQLRALPISMVTWAEWKSAHPTTTVVVGREDYERLYKREPYNTYFVSKNLRFPVGEYSTALGQKDRVVAVLRDQRWQVRKLVGADERGAPTFMVDSSAEAAAVSLWFAWSAIRGDAELMR